MERNIQTYLNVISKKDFFVKYYNNDIDLLNHHDV